MPVSDMIGGGGVGEGERGGGGGEGCGGEGGGGGAGGGGEGAAWTLIWSRWTCKGKPTFCCI